MVLGTTTEVEQIAKVENDNGEQVPPASDDFRHIYGEVDLSAENGSFGFTAPARASSLTLHVEGWSNTGEVAVHFLDPDGERLTTRDGSDNEAFQTDGTTDIFVQAAVASPFIEFEITGSDTVTVTGYCR